MTGKERCDLLTCELMGRFDCTTLSVFKEY